MPEIRMNSLRSVGVLQETESPCALGRSRLDQYARVEVGAPHRAHARPRRRSTSRSTSALVSSLTPRASIFLRSRISLRPRGEGGLPGGGSSSLPLEFAAFFIVFILPPAPGGGVITGSALNVCA